MATAAKRKTESPKQSKRRAAVKPHARPQPQMPVEEVVRMMDGDVTIQESLRKDVAGIHVELVQPTSPIAEHRIDCAVAEDDDYHAMGWPNIPRPLWIAAALIAVVIVIGIVAR